MTRPELPNIGAQPPEWLNLAYTAQAAIGAWLMRPLNEKGAEWVAYADELEAKVAELEARGVQYRKAIDRLQAELAQQGPGLEPGLDAHFLNHFWGGLWFGPLPIAVYRDPSCLLTFNEVQQALAAWNLHTRETTSGKLPDFFVLQEPDDYDPSDFGVFLFGREIPAWALKDWSEESGYFMGVRVKRFLRDPEGRRPAYEQQRWALSNIPLSENAYGLGGLIHELGHVLGLADHYYMAGPENDGKEGLYEDSDSVMANPGLGIRPHDVEDLTTLYQSELRYQL